MTEVSYKPLLSIIVPVYNSEDYIEECLISICTQSYENIEIIVINDGSTDKSEGIIKKLAYAYPQIKLYNKKNEGPSIARNLGIEIASGDLITFVDSDDKLLNYDLYKRAIEYFSKDKDLDVIQFDVIHNWNSEFENKRSYPFTTYNSKIDIARGFLSECIHTSFCDKIFKSDCIKKIKLPNVSICEDIAVLPQFIEGVNKIRTIDIGYYGYRYHEGSRSKSTLSYNKINAILKSYYIYLTYTYNYKELKGLTISIYTGLIWAYASHIRKYLKNDIRNFSNYKDNRIMLSLNQWIRILPQIRNCSIIIKSFITCVLGVKYIIRFQDILTR